MRAPLPGRGVRGVLPPALPTEHLQNSRSYFVSGKLILSYHYVHSMVREWERVKDYRIGTTPMYSLNN